MGKAMLKGILKGILKGEVWLGWQCIKVCVFARTMAAGWKTAYMTYKENIPSLHNEYMSDIHEKVNLE